MWIFSYIHKVKKIQKKIGYTAFFTPAEIVSAIINLWDAKQKLNSEEYFYVNVLYETYRLLKNEVCLDCFGFLGLCNEIIAHFDLVAPYYKFCGSNNLQMEIFRENLKKPYREEARELLNQKLLFKDEWMSLHKEFMEKFYS